MITIVCKNVSSIYLVKDLHVRTKFVHFVCSTSFIIHFKHIMKLRTNALKALKLLFTFDLNLLLLFIKYIVNKLT